MLDLHWIGKYLYHYLCTLFLYLYAIHNDIHRLQPVPLRKEDDKSKVVGEFKGRMFFKLYLKDSDFVGDGLLESPSVVQPLNMKPPHLMVSYFSNALYWCISLD